MKKLILPLLVFLLVMACGLPTATPAPATESAPATDTAAPTTVSINLPLADSPELSQFYFVNENDGWAQTQTQVVRTIDGGATWYNATPQGLTQAGYLPFHFMDANTGWVLSPSADYTTGTLYRTSDGGLTWIPISVPFASASLQFLDANTGFALAALGAGAGSEAVALFKTTDGGSNWTRVFINDPTVSGSNDSLPLGGQKLGFAFIDSLRGWVGGYIPMDNYIYLYATQDGGVTWQETNLKLPADYQTAQTGNTGPQFFSATDGVLVVNMSMPAAQGTIGIIYRTNDGGKTWTPGQAINASRVFDFLSATNGVAWGPGQFEVTTDAGQTWGSVTPNQNFNDSLITFQFVSPLIGWVLTSPDGTNFSLYKTTDGGATWNLLVP